VICFRGVSRKPEASRDVAENSVCAENSV